jgi:hypothetical protein
MNARARFGRLFVTAAIAALLGSMFVVQAAFAEVPDIGNDLASATGWPTLPIATSTYENLEGSLTPATDQDDIFAIQLNATKMLFVELVPSAGATIQAGLFDQTATSTAQVGGSDPVDVSYPYPGDLSQYMFTPITQTGTYFLDVKLLQDSAAGTYSIYADQFPMPYSFEGFTVPKKAKRGKWFTCSVVVTPGYIGNAYRPVTIYAQKKKGKKWGTKVAVGLHGYSIDDGNKYAAKLKLSKGTWRVWAVFKDADHSFKTKYKNCLVK